ncbi:amino acid ABC transporter ATP-binding/permease protein [Mediterraneibacter glycyrrhizinilyticus]|uniref:amino acid ABC transporter ATP-binding/permease protein n=1 Tax=Mediterraneibacter glycyrrhizinilyticus TaxID=342942 RepID=UPI001D086348|nr:ABC transporter ATP-binding protein [Mediterraneibacter glycyrrhizinilyticus]MCB6309168.1 ABC transporter ATP-binding protein/permease [Lachnospiraceae bacterium 210521-DFI.1.109]MCB6426515.1 ABC transporter ATP-binding protein/permease [Mediterraneibacter glycyrrhizinilyticus]
MKRSGFNIMIRLIGLVKPLTGYMILAVAMGLIGHLCASFITVFGGYAILHVLHPEWSWNLTALFVAVLMFALLRGFLRYVEQACNHFIAFKLLALIRDKVFGALRRLCPAKLDGKDKGNLISIITSDIELLEVFYAHTISPICIAVLFSFVMISFIGSYHAALGGGALIAYVTVGALIPFVTSRLSGDDGVRFRTKSGQLSGFVLDSLRGLSETIQYGQGKRRMEEIDRRTEQLSKDEEHMKRIVGRNTAVTNTVILMFDLAMLFLSAKLVGFEGCLIVTFALMSSFGPVVALASLGATLQNTFAAGGRVLDILDECPVVEEITGKEEVDFHGAEVKNVTFAYGEETILKDVSVTIPENKIIGINGRSGSGKSTLLKLLMRFWQVRQGAVKVSGRNVEEINTSNLRDMESFVTQETHLFHDSIRNNLRIAKLNASDEEIITACRKASVHDFIMSLSKGYDTEVGELGDTLSGGERQRLGLARAFLHDAPFLLLDEPTSNLDSLNEAVILKSLHEACADKSVVLVSHRKSTMGIADTVYSVEHGRMS